MTTEEWNDKPAGGPTMTPTTLAETILKDVPRYEPRSDAIMRLRQHGRWLFLDEVPAALNAALDPAIAERAGEVMEGVTPGPWEERFADGGWEVDGGERFCTPVHRGGKFENARFIAWCREGVPALLAQNAALRAGVEQRDAAIDKMLNHCEATEERAEAAERELRELKEKINAP